LRAMLQVLGAGIRLFKEVSAETASYYTVRQGACQANQGLLLLHYRCGSAIM